MPLNPTHEPAARAFCSYVHKDNQSLSGAIQHIIEDIRLFHEAETGRPIQIFFDRTDIGWGQDLRTAISDSVENATFFIPMITARYFQSESSRDELLSFYGKCRTLGVTELILPIILAGRSQISEDSEDEVVRIVAQIRFEDWTEIWQSGRGSPAWNIGITRLVQRLVALQERVEGHLANTLISSLPENAENPEDTTQAVAEPWAACQADRVQIGGRSVLDEVDKVVSDMRTLFADLGNEFDRIKISDYHEMRLVLDRIGARYATRGHDVGRRARAALDDLIEYDAQVRSIIRSSRSLTSRDQTAPLSKQVSAMRESALRLGDSIRVVDEMSEVLRRYSDMSVGLRVALSPIRAGLQTIRDIAHILDGWVSLET
jgi:TIR domain-containing protein